MIEFSIDIAQVLGLLAGVILPVLVGLVTKHVTDSGVKAALLAGLSVGINLITEVANALSTGAAYDLGAALMAGLGTFVVGVALHYGLWKPTGVSDKAQSVGEHVA